ncbi:MAG: ABC transporter permease [Chryseolinea sp.]
MMTNFFKTAVRNILRERQYALIKIGGLALGLGTCLVLLLYITHQLSFDEMHPDVNRTYRVNQTNIWTPDSEAFSATGPAVSSALTSEFPEIQEAVRVYAPGTLAIRSQNADGTVTAINEGNIIAADSNFFSFFGFKLKEGDPKSALIGKNKVVLSDKAAYKLFGKGPALGKIIMVGDSMRAAEVTGVTEQQPDNIHFHFDYLFSLYSHPEIKEMEWSWIWTQVVTYVKLRPNTDADALASKIKTAPSRHALATFQRLGMDYKEFVKQKGGWELYLQPMLDIHLYSERLGNRLGSVGNIDYVKILGVIAAFIMLIAVVNFVNLSTARGSKRAKEIGVKKTLGVTRGSLILQFQIEHILITMISMLLGLGVMEVLRLIIQPTLGIDIPLTGWSKLQFTALIIFMPLIIGFLGGLYPSFYLTSFKPVTVLKGKLSTGFASSGLRNSLVVFQFTISIALMAATLIVFQQLDRLHSMNLGFSKENLLVINDAQKLGNHVTSFRDEISKYPGVVNTSVSMDIRGGYEDIYNKEGDSKKVSIIAYKADPYFMETVQIPIKAGRTFDVNRPSDVNAVVISETTAKTLGWSAEEALGKKIEYLSDEVGKQEVIGVTNDFYFQSLRQSLMPTMFLNINAKSWGDTRIVLVRFESDKLHELVNALQARWTQMEDIPFSYTILNEQLMARYQQEEKIAGLFSIFTILSVIISVTGLVGLVAYSAEQRKKEIGIRKVFGASLGKIYVMINTQYVKLLAIAMLVATPATWWLMQQWLDTWAFKTDINPMIFVASGIAELVLALICVGYLAIRAAMLNPTTVLKDE